MSYYSIKRNQVQYLEQLQHQNKVRKLRELSQNKTREHLIKREQGFHLLMNGANEIRIREHRQREERERSKSPVMRKRWSHKAERNEHHHINSDVAKPTEIIERQPDIQESTAGSLRVLNQPSNTVTAGFEANSPTGSAVVSPRLEFSPDTVTDLNEDALIETKINERVKSLSSAKKKKLLEMLDELEKE
ncbi:unnamed protein product [Blepharisma stoltei]|uniref:Uncharacterized protein n=1 Tax=Blepharisma stoltei TaxID=1481888 RepID=A0AAU9JYE4_9CILI|nr:unnamed protein product [Blepharisma stoltei]